MKLFIVLTIFSTTCYAGDFDNLVLRFFGTSYNDYQNLTMTGSFNSINGTYFNETKLSALIIHGRSENYTSDVVKELYSAFATRSNYYNIILADWGAKSKDFYPSIMFYLNDMADNFVYLLNKTKTAGYDLKKIYPVGFGVGAHVAGRIGSIFKDQGNTLPRITGLDPTGVLYNCPAIIAKIFGVDANLTPIKPLFKGDASFVDVIHTNAFWYRGIDVAIGDVDFWPNGGVTQPKCDKNCTFPDVIFKVEDCSSCSHDAAFYYFAESVRSLVPNFSAKGCPKNTLIKSSSSCKESATANMGFYASSTATAGSYWLETNKGWPYSKLF
ncbi:endothelial lipase-like [Chironomus tepperi]|uniref:endothelial lipase-like n=1 Tax=Chironomus tepperi TaxID=113505 RepID=UPI00391F8BB6